MIPTLFRIGVTVTVILVTAYAPAPIAVKLLCIALVAHGFLAGD